MGAWLYSGPLLALLATGDLGSPSNVPESKGRVPYNKPKPSPLRQLAEEHFPGAWAGQDVFLKATRTLERHGFEADNTLLALSVCPDEINHQIGDLTDHLHQYFGQTFHLGGLGGIPFTGKTGFSAFSNHVSKAHDGNCFIVMAPHIGLSSAKHLGMYTTSDDTERTACGAAVGALQYCLNNKEIPPLDSDDFDYQEDYIIRQINQVQDEILLQESENAVQRTLAHHMWKISKTKLDQVINTDFGGSNSKLGDLTGVVVYMPRAHGDLFQPLTFDMYLKDGTVVSVFEETFGPPKVPTKLKP